MAKAAPKTNRRKGVITTTAKKGKISVVASKIRKPIRSNKKSAVEARIKYHVRMKDPVYRAKIQEYRKNYYLANKVDLDKKAALTHAARGKDALKKQRTKLKNLRAKHGIQGSLGAWHASKRKGAAERFKAAEEKHAAKPAKAAKPVKAAKPAKPQSKKPKP